MSKPSGARAEAEKEAAQILSVVQPRVGDPKDPREFSYWVSFPTTEARASAASEARERRFSTPVWGDEDNGEEEDDDDEPEGPPYDLELTRADSVTLDALIQTLEALFEIVARHQGEYDGWEVETSSPSMA